MSNDYYTLWCADLTTLTPEEIEWLEYTLDLTEHISAVGVYGGDALKALLATLPPDLAQYRDKYSETSGEDGNVSAGDVRLRITEGNVLNTYSEDIGDLAITAAFLVDFIRRWRPDEVFKIEWANTSNGMDPGDFGGGAVVISREGTSWMNTTTWAEKEKKRIVWVRQGARYE